VTCRLGDGKRVFFRQRLRGLFRAVRAERNTRLFLTETRVVAHAEEGKGNGKGNSKEKGIVRQTPGGVHICRVVACQLQREMYYADLDMEG